MGVCVHLANHYYKEAQRFRQLGAKNALREFLLKCELKELIHTSTTPELRRTAHPAYMQGVDNVRNQLQLILDAEGARNVRAEAAVGE